MKKLGVLALMLVMAINLAACGGKTEQAPQQGAEAAKKEVKTLRVGYLNVMDDAQAMLAYDAGFYEKNGLKVEMQLFSSGTDLIKGIVGGQLDAGVLGFTNAITWGDKGAGLKVVGGAQLGYHSLLVSKDSDIKSVADLKGKSIASQKKGSTADIVLTGVTLEGAKLGKNDVQMQYVEPPVAIQALAAGKVDAAFVFEPYDSIARAQFGAKSIYEVGTEWPFPCMVVITSDAVLEKDRDAVNRMLDAQKQAIEMMQKDPEGAAKFLTKRFVEGDSIKSVDGKDVKAEAVIAEAIKSQTFTWEITPDQVTRMQELADIMQKQGVLKEAVDVKQILDLSWQEQLKK
ncbi:ABC transporter substrate-binding protein [Paenibacillus turpanensis]|uniref:ABC transporter substrate-binding protein n=1 Tax=Paenibacillus turpanensis TaxID=2689078 RepID=UPI00140C4A04|nr:ABC transporter substrate-binding protein [Paenibacillus turpanensis]